MSGGLTFSERARAEKFARWEQAGVDAVAADFKARAGSLVGLGVQERALAEEWFQIKYADKTEVMEKRRRSELMQPSESKPTMLPFLEWLWQLVTFR